MTLLCFLLVFLPFSSTCIYKYKPPFNLFNVFSVYWQHEVPDFAGYSNCSVSQHWKGNQFLEHKTF